METGMNEMSMLMLLACWLCCGGGGGSVPGVLAELQEAQANIERTQQVSPREF